MLLLKLSSRCTYKISLFTKVIYKSSYIPMNYWDFNGVELTYLNFYTRAKSAVYHAHCALLAMAGGRL